MNEAEHEKQRQQQQQPMPIPIRPARHSDAEAIANIHFSTRQSSPHMPNSIHPLGAVRAWIEGHLGAAAGPGTDTTSSASNIWVATTPDGKEVTGYLRMSGDGLWLDDLFVDTDSQQKGIGSALLAKAKELQPKGFSLWVFESNEPARSFYRERGLVEREWTDGKGNEEGVPDLRMEWVGEEGR
jgi:ribosomal protein S18 acetylase RimI-like enzyme